MASPPEIPPPVTETATPSVPDVHEFDLGSTSVVGVVSAAPPLSEGLTFSSLK